MSLSEEERRDFQKQLNKIASKTEARVDKLQKELKDVERNTYWKIKDYERLVNKTHTSTVYTIQRAIMHFNVIRF